MCSDEGKKASVKRLEITEKYLIALQIIDMLPEENRNEQYGKLIDYIFEKV